MAALNRANTDHALGYGDDKWTEEAVAKIKETFSASPTEQDAPKVKF
jgi:threonine aldolase